jgi:hypothetical protein
MPNPWLNCTRLPRGPAAALAALHLAEPHTDALAGLDRREWEEALDFSDRSQMTLALHQRAADAVPAAIGEILDVNLAHNIERLHNVEGLYQFLDQQLGAAGIEFLALKGLTQCPLFGSDPEHRPQYDIDLYMPRQTVFAARDVLLAAGFEPLPGMEAFPTDHVPSLIRKTGWQWRGDIFDPEMPLPVELHFRFWNRELERLTAPGVDEFWSRRERRCVAGIPLATLCAPDSLAYSALHLLKHVFHGNTRPFHVYELACFLDARAADEAFWREWRSLHAPELRHLEAVAFALADSWFGCRLGPAMEEISVLPSSTLAWFEEFAVSPAAAPYDSNKDELWLHFSLLASGGDRFRVARRRLLPSRLPGPVDDAVYAPHGSMTWHRRLLQRLRYGRYLAHRFRHHAVSLWRLARSGVQWRRIRSRPSLSPPKRGG